MFVPYFIDLLIFYFSFPAFLLVSVADTGTRGTVIRAHADTMSSRGRGLGLIEDLSDSWGTDPTVRGTTVWFEMLIPGSR